MSQHILPKLHTIHLIARLAVVRDLSTRGAGAVRRARSLRKTAATAPSTSATEQDDCPRGPHDALNLRAKVHEKSTTFNFFEQDIAEVLSDKPRRRRISEAKILADEREGRRLAGVIGRLEQDITTMEREPEVAMERTLMRLRAEAGRLGRDEGKAWQRNDPAELQNTIRRLHSAMHDSDDEMLADADPEHVRAEMDALRVVVPDGHMGTSEKVMTLNNCLRHAYLATESDRRPVVRTELWKAYKRAKMNVPSVLEGVPPPAWDILFHSQAVRWKSNRKRLEHMRELLADMKSVGIDGPPTIPPNSSILQELHSIRPVVTNSSY